jgi:hypothetical protein
MKASLLVALSLAIAAMGLYVASDDPPGAPIGGFLLMLVAIVIGMRTARSRMPIRARRAALAVGVLIAGFAAFFIHAVTAAPLLFAQPTDVPSVSKSAPPPQWAAVVDRARSIARSTIVEQNLPGVSIAVGAGADVVWAEGFGWRDVGTETPITPETRFNIGSAAPAVAAAVASLGLTYTGTDPAAEWSPEAVGEEGEDFPPLTAIRHLILQPIGVAPAEYPLRGDRATFYVPATRWKNDTTDPRLGRRLMFMRDLACCAGKMAFYSTPSDLVRFGLATKANSVDGQLAGGSVMSLVASRDNAIVVAVASNIAHAGTAALATKVADVFAEHK